MTDKEFVEHWTTQAVAAKMLGSRFSMPREDRTRLHALFYPHRAPAAFIDVPEVLTARLAQARDSLAAAEERDPSLGDEVGAQ